MINPNMIELNSAIKLKQTDSNAPIQKNEWFNKGKDNDLNLHRLQGVISLNVYLIIFNFFFISSLSHFEK